MAKIHKTMRLEEETAERIRALMEDGETETAAYARVIEAGLETLEPRLKPEKTGAGDGAPGASERRGDGEAEALLDHIGTLKEANARLIDQLAAKDAQIEALTRITEQAQALTAIEAKRGTMALESEDGKRRRRGLFARIFGRD